MLGTALIVYCLFAEMPLSRLPVIMIGALLVVLYEFHSRIDGLLGFWKFRVPIGAKPGSGEAEESPDPTELERRRQARAATSGETVTMDWNPPPRSRYRR